MDKKLVVKNNKNEIIDIEDIFDNATDKSYGKKIVESSSNKLTKEFGMDFLL